MQLAKPHPIGHYVAMHNDQTPVPDAPVANETRLTLIEAIARKQAVIARYNGSDIKLAPHLLFERRGDLFVGALNMSKAVRAGDEPQLGQFKLAGLAAARLLAETFDTLPSFAATAPRADDTLILAI